MGRFLSMRRAGLSMGKTLLEEAVEIDWKTHDTIIDMGDPRIEALIDEDLYFQFKDELEVLDELGQERVGGQVSHWRYPSGADHS